MSPSRRSFLQIAGTVLSAGFAGCLSPDGADTPTTTEPDSPTARTTTDVTTTDATTTDVTTEETTHPTEETTTTLPEEPPAVREVDGIGRKVPQPLDLEAPDADPFLAFAVGSCECGSDPRDNKPHGVWVWNDTDEVLTVELELTADGATVLDDAYEFDPYAPLALELRVPRRYELTVRAGDREETVTVSRSSIDCNDSATDVAIRDAEMESSTITTNLACRTATTASDTA